MPQLFGGEPEVTRPSSTTQLFGAPVVTPTVTKQKPVKKVTPTPTVTPTKKKEPAGFISQAKEIVRKIGEGITFTFVKPKIISPLPDSENQPIQVQKSVSIKPNQKRLTKTQLSTIIGSEQTFLRQAPKKTVWQKVTDKIGRFFDPTLDKKARAMNAVALKKTKAGSRFSLSQLAEKGGNPLKNSAAEQVTKELGIRNIPTTSELGQSVFTAAIALGLATAPVQTLVGLGVFTAVNELKSGLISAVKGKGFKIGADQTLSDLFEDSPADVKNVLDVIDFLAVAKTTHSIFKTSPKAFEKLTKDTIEQYNAPKTINIPAKEVQKVLRDRGGKQEAEYLKKLGLTSTQWRSAVKRGVTVEIPTEKITRIVDKPYWKKVKRILGKEPTNRVKVEGGEIKSREGIAGLLEAGEKTPDQVIGAVISSGKTNTPEGKLIIKSALEAKAKGKNILIEKAKKPTKKEIAKVFNKQDFISATVGEQNKDIGNLMWQDFNKYIDKTVSPNAPLDEAFELWSVDSKLLREFERLSVEEFKSKYLKAEKPTTPPLSPTKKRVPSQPQKEAVGERIPKELEPLAREARKYKSAEEFVKALDEGEVGKRLERELKNLPDAKTRFIRAWGIFSDTPKGVTRRRVRDLTELAKPKELSSKRASFLIDREVKRLYEQGKQNKFAWAQKPLSSNRARLEKQAIMNVVAKERDSFIVNRTKNLTDFYNQAKKVIEKPKTTERKVKKQLPQKEIQELNDADLSLLESKMAKEIESEDTSLAKKARRKLEEIQQEIEERKGEREVKKSILDQFSTNQIRAMRMLKRAIEVRENQGKDPTSVSELPIYKKHIEDIMSAINTNSEDIALRYIMEELPDKLASSTTREELRKIKVYKTYIEPKKRAVPRSQLPVGEGKEKVSRLEARIRGQLNQTSQETIEKLGLSTFKQMSKKEQIAKASTYVLDNTNEAMQVLLGNVEVPSGLTYNSIYVVMQNLAKGDVALARKLASLQATRFGQEISILTEIDPNSPVSLMQEIVRIRENTFKKRHKGKTVSKVKKKIAKNIKAKVKKPDKFDWNNFIKSIEC